MNYTRNGICFNKKLGLLLTIAGIFSILILNSCFGNQEPKTSTPTNNIPTNDISASNIPTNNISIDNNVTNIETDYFHATVNSDGSLNFVNKINGNSILNSSPKYFCNYGAETSVDVSPENSSFEKDANADGIPDGWVADKNYIQDSTEQVSDGSKSLKFDMTVGDISHRHLYSPLIAVNLDKEYSISLNACLDSFVTGASSIFIVYYNTIDGKDQSPSQKPWLISLIK